MTRVPTTVWRSAACRMHRGFIWWTMWSSQSLLIHSSCRMTFVFQTLLWTLSREWTPSTTSCTSAQVRHESIASQRQLNKPRKYSLKNKVHFDLPHVFLSFFMDQNMAQSWRRWLHRTRTCRVVTWRRWSSSQQVCENQSWACRSCTVIGHSSLGSMTKSWRSH